MESCALPMEAPREVTTLWPVACSYRGISWSLAAEKPPEVTTRISSAAAVEGVAAPRARPRPRLRAPPSSAPRVRRRRVDGTEDCRGGERVAGDRESTRLNSSQPVISYAGLFLKK